MKEKDWSEGEIRDIVHQEMRDERKQLNTILDRLADGAQASIYSATILHGNPELGLKGFVPDVQERLARAESTAAVEAILNSTRHSDNTGRMDGFDTRLKNLENGQHRIRRVVTATSDFVLKTRGRWDYIKVTGLFGAVGTAVHFLPPWAAVKKFLLAFGVAFGSAMR